MNWITSRLPDRRPTKRLRYEEMANANLVAESSATASGTSKGRSNGTVNTREHRDEFAHMSLRDNESTSDFILRLRHKADRCKFSRYEYDERIIQKVHSATPHKRLKDKITAKDIGDCTLQEVEEYAQELDAGIISTFRDKETVNNGRTCITSSKRNYRYPEKDSCHKCGANHPPRKCPAYHEVCLRCGRRGHLDKMCHKKDGSWKYNGRRISSGSGGYIRLGTYHKNDDRHIQEYRRAPKRLTTTGRRSTGIGPRPPPAKVRHNGQTSTTTVETLDQSPEPINEPCSSSAIQRTALPGKDQRGPTPSKPGEFKEYAKKYGPSAFRKSPKPHVIMNNIEKLVYENRVAEAETERGRFFKQIEYQSHPSAEDFVSMIDDITGKKNPVRAALFRAACSCKLRKEIPDVEIRASGVADQISEICKLVQNLAGGPGKSQTVLDDGFLNNGACAFQVAKFLLSVMEELFTIEFADDKSRWATQPKANALKWLGIGLYETKRYKDAIRLLEHSQPEYGSIKNDITISIYEMLGLCFEKEQKFFKSLQNLQTAKKLALHVGCLDVEKFESLDTCIHRVKKRFQRPIS